MVRIVTGADAGSCPANVDHIFWNTQANQGPRDAPEQLCRRLR